MKINLFGTFASLAFGGFVTGLMLGLSHSPSTDRIVWIVMIGIAAFACAMGYMGISDKDGRRSTNIRALATLFAFVFAVSLTILGLCHVNAVVTACCTGIVLLIYSVLIAKISKMDM